MDKVAVVFTMKGCRYCEELKTMLKEADISFINRDIEEYEEEYYQDENADDAEEMQRI